MFASLVFTDQFLEDFAQLKQPDRRLVRKALDLLNQNEQHPSLQVHQLSGSLKGTWSASASRRLRLTFERLPDGKKVVLTCTLHYSD